MDRKFIYGATGVLCLVALLSLPYGFYTFLRLVVSVASITAAMQLKSEENNFWLVFGGLALLFNPVLPVYLDREFWIPIDVVAACLFGWMSLKNAPK